MRDPFGDPDGAKAKDDEILKDFIDYASPFPTSHDSIDNELDVRILIGRKGSGKTHYLRRAHVLASSDHDRFADDIRSDHPQTEKVIIFWRLFREDPEGKWKFFWRRAIIASYLTHALFNSKLGSSNNKWRESEAAAELARRYRKHICDYKRQVSPFAIINSVISKGNSRNAISAFIDDPIWSEIESEVIELLKQGRPIYFFLDSFDDEFEKAPVQWLSFYRGLLDCILQLYREHSIGGKLHVVACIRDFVLTANRNSEHATRYATDRSIKILSWGYEAARLFFEEKLKRLGRNALIDSEASDPMSRWLGMTEIQNVSRDCREDLFLYILRHTRLIPRDIIAMGNIISRRIRECSPDTSAIIRQEVIRSAVAIQANVFGVEQLRICANEVVAASIIKSDSFLPGRHLEAQALENSSFTEAVADSIGEVLKYLNRDRLTHEDIQFIREDGSSKFGEGVNLPNLLWKYRLLGACGKMVEKYGCEFYVETNPKDGLPNDAAYYVLHPILVDALRIEAIGPPVIPFAFGSPRSIKP
jgi:hypothetical protein